MKIVFLKIYVLLFIGVFFHSLFSSDPKFNVDLAATMRADIFVNKYLEPYFNDLWKSVSVALPLKGKDSEDKIRFVGLTFPVYAAFVGIDLKGIPDIETGEPLFEKVEKIKVGVNTVFRSVGLTPPASFFMNFSVLPLDPQKGEAELFITNDTSIPWKINFSNNQKAEVIPAGTKNFSVKTRAPIFRIFIEDPLLKEKNKNKSTYFSVQTTYPKESYTIKKDDKENFILMDDSINELVEGFNSIIPSLQNSL